MGLINVLFRNRRKTYPWQNVHQNSIPRAITDQNIAQSHETDKSDDLAFSESLSKADSKKPNPVLQAQVNKNNLLVLEQIKSSKNQTEEFTANTLGEKKRSTPEERAIRLRNIVNTLNGRRNAICSELERSCFRKGTILEKHRHNLQISFELTIRGLL